jgi:hypothetical protein
VRVVEPSLSEEERVQAARLISLGEKLPDPLRHKVIALLFHKGPRRTRGPDPMMLFPRNVFILSVVSWIVEEYGVAATRNVATEADSAASIVSQALRELGEKISEKQVNKIYQQCKTKKLIRAIRQIQHSVDDATQKDMQNSGDPPLLIPLGWEQFRRKN